MGGAAALGALSGGMTVPRFKPLRAVDTFILDTFTDTDGTNLNAHIPDSGAIWTAHAGTMTVQTTGIASPTSAVADYTQDTTHSDGEISCQFRCGASTNLSAPSIIFRGCDATHYLLAYFSGDGALRLYQRFGATFTVLSSTVWIPDTSWHLAKVVYQHDSIQIYVDTVLHMTYSHNGYVRGTRVGIRGFKNGANADAFNDFTYSSPDGVTVPTYPGDFTTVTVNDSFEADDSTNLNTWGWTAHNGLWLSRCNYAEQFHMAAPVTGYLTTQDIGVVDYAVEATIVTPVIGDFITGIVLRGQDATHFVEVEINKGTAYGGWAGFGCWDYNNTGTFTPIGMRYFEPQNNAVYTVRAQVSGETIICELVEAGLRFTGSCPLFATTGTRVGLFESRDPTIRLVAPRYAQFIART